MSRNKYKNNEPLNEKVKQPMSGEGSDSSLPDFDEPEPTEEQGAIIDEERQRAAEPSREYDGIQRGDVWDNAQAVGPSAMDPNETDYSSDGGIGEFKDTLIDDGVPRKKVTEVMDPDSGPGHVGAKVPAKGFPWWWILLPLIIIGIIWGLTRKPVDNTKTPESTTTQIPTQIMMVEKPQYFTTLELL